MTIVAIQQPEHLPWMGFFDKMLKCDQYVFLDNVQFKKRYFENRNKIRTRQGEQWVTVPVRSKGRYHQKINEVLVDNDKNWQKKYLGAVRQAYSRSDYFGEYFPELEEVISQGFDELVNLNLALIEWVATKLEIKTPTIKASQLRAFSETGSELILEICKDLNATTYLSGPDGRNYLNVDEFQKSGIALLYHNYQHPVYCQMQQPFASHMSILDLFFNEHISICKNFFREQLT